MFHLLAASALRPRQCHIEHRATRVGVDLDEPNAIVRDMEVIAEEHALRSTWVMARNCWCPAQYPLSIGVHGSHRVDRVNDPRHALLMRRRHEHRPCREEVGTTFADELV